MKTKTQVSLALLVIATGVAAEATTNTVAAKKIPQLGVLSFENRSDEKKPITVDNPAYKKTRIPGVVTDAEGALGIELATIVVDYYGEMARTRLEQALSDWPELQLIERNRLEPLKKELDLNKARGGTRSEEESIWRRYGCNFLVLGQIESAWTEEFATTAYGLSFDNVHRYVEISIRLNEVSSERPVYMGRATGSYTISNVTGHRNRHSDPFAAALKDAISQLTADHRFKAAVLGGIASRSVTAFAVTAPGETVAVTFAPQNITAADVEIDGNYLGTTPITIDLPSGHTTKVRLMLAKESLWEHTILPRKGLSVRPQLTQDRVSQEPEPNNP